MKTGDIILIPFPFAEFTNVKVRPAVVITETKDKYKDVVVSAISSVIPPKISDNEMIIRAQNINNLRTDSVIKVDRIVTVKQENIIDRLGRLTEKELTEFKRIFQSLVD